MRRASGKEMFNASSVVGGRPVGRPCLLERFGAGPEERRRPQDVPSRQSADALDPRDGDQLDRHPDDGGVQQSRASTTRASPQNSPQSIVPDLAKSWAWSADGKDLTFKLQEGVKWHDGKPFTAKDVVCTFDLLTGKGEDKLRTNPRKTWYSNVDKRHGQRRLRGDRSTQASAAVAALAARLGLLADVPLPRAGGADAHQADRHRALQVRRVQAERRHQGHAQHRLLEEGQALSRRHRIHHRAQPRHGDAELRRRAASTSPSRGK